MLKNTPFLTPQLINFENIIMKLRDKKPPTLYFNYTTNANKNKQQQIAEINIFQGVVEREGEFN